MRGLPPAPLLAAGEFSCDSLCWHFLWSSGRGRGDLAWLCVVGSPDPIPGSVYCRPYLGNLLFSGAAWGWGPEPRGLGWGERERVVDSQAPLPQTLIALPRTPAPHPVWSLGGVRRLISLSLEMLVEASANQKSGQAAGASIWDLSSPTSGLSGTCLGLCPWEQGVGPSLTAPESAPLYVWALPQSLNWALLLDAAFQGLEGPHTYTPFIATAASPLPCTLGSSSYWLLLFLLGRLLSSLLSQHRLNTTFCDPGAEEAPDLQPSPTLPT